MFSSQSTFKFLGLITLAALHAVPAFAHDAVTITQSGPVTNFSVQSLEHEVDSVALEVFRLLDRAGARHITAKGFEIVRGVAVEAVQSFDHYTAHLVIDSRVSQMREVRAPQPGSRAFLVRGAIASELSSLLERGGGPGRKIPGNMPIPRGQIECRNGPELTCRILVVVE